MNSNFPLQSFDYGGVGYRPLLIQPGWQVARLNSAPELCAGQIRRVERHLRTDEVFILLKGVAVLICAVEAGGGLLFQALRMRAGLIYNVPGAVWHAIAMTPGDEVVIVEKDNTHCSDVSYRDLSETDYAALQVEIRRAAMEEES